MAKQTQSGLLVEDIQILGHTRSITVRTYRRSVPVKAAPVIIYLHGGSFTGGSLDDADIAAATIASSTPAWVVSVGYSLAPQFPFPNAPEDVYRALVWAANHARDHQADSRRIGIAGHDAGGNLATCVAAIARDRGEVKVSAQALLAPLLDPSMTRLAESRNASESLDITACASCYRAYLPTTMLRLHPYAAPLESRRLQGLPPALIASVQNDQLHVEAERYASELIAAGVPTEVTRYVNTSHTTVSTHPEALADLAVFFQRRLAKQVPVHKF
ncbi:alpha/beta hydrolase [Paraburkholderia fungorum]|uniref:alpha/beta hydrolase n=1 Tax=Paraburkholderia fungorum TaxID=134537 RepID=UPI00402B61EB